MWADFAKDEDPSSDKEAPKDAFGSVWGEGEEEGDFEEFQGAEETAGWAANAWGAPSEPA